MPATLETASLPLPGDELLDSTFTMISHVLRARRCSLMLLDEDQHLVVRKAHGLDAEVIAQTKLALGERIAGHVAATRQPLLITDIGSVANAAPHKGYATGSFLSVPVAAGARLYGVLNAADKVGDVPFDEFDLRTLTLLAQHVALCIENAELHRHIARLANTDGVTGLYNHRYFQERLEEEMERARRFGHGVALLMTDLDSFKEFNDHHGHPAGDVVLQEVASVLRGAVRQSDIVSRYGGDEFAIIAPETYEEAAEALARRLGRAIAGHRFHVLGTATPLKLGLSIGISAYPGGATCKSQLIEQADRAMYLAKQRQRGICSWSAGRLPGER